MKICYLADGGSIHTYRYIKYFAERKHDIYLISMRPIRKETKKLNIRYYENTINSKTFLIHLIITFLTLPLIIKKIRKFKPDILHAHDIFAYGIHAFLSRLKYILTPWGTDILIMPKKNWIYSKILPKIISKAQYVIYEGENMYDTLIRYCSKKEKLKLFRFGIDTKHFSKHKKINLTHKYKDRILIISTRNLEPVYDIETLIKSTKLVLEKNKNVHFLIVGEGSEKEMLQELTKKLKISRYISFLGKLSYNDMPKYLSSSDIYVSTSLSDGGLATSTMEAMSCGLPVITTDFGDNSKWIKPGKNGFLFKPKDSISLANHILYLIEKEEKREMCGKNNMMIIHRSQDYYLEKRKLEEFYLTMMKNG